MLFNSYKVCKLKLINLQQQNQAHLCKIVDNKYSIILCLSDY